MNLLVKKEFAEHRYEDIFKIRYTDIHDNIKKIQQERNNTVHSNFIMTYRNKSFNVQYNIKKIASQGVKSIRKLKEEELKKLGDLTNKTVSELSDFSIELRVLMRSKSM